ncbi:MAG TPA: CADD family putative folate metabolism protein [Thermoplasmata archaeon]|nr:CADD family putative folate metabolism protein [Thermoplasmata archaeon]
MPGTRALDRAIRERHLLKHPFYTAWTKGELPLPTLQRYAGQYYHFERAFPQYVAAAYARIPDPRGRRVLLENLIDEEGRDPTHPELWLQFAEGLGVRRAAVTRGRPLPSTSALCRTYEELTLNGSAPQALGALYAYESIFPEVAAEKSRGLAAHYGITDAAAHEFFRVHTEADVAHSAAERQLLAREMARNPRAARAALAAVNRTVTGWWKFLDAFTA